MKSAMSSTNTTTLLKNQVVDNLEFSNATMDKNKLTVEVVNKSNDIYSLNSIDVKYLDSTGKEITTVNGYIGNTLEKDESYQLVVDTEDDLSNAYSIEYYINK